MASDGHRLLNLSYLALAAFSLLSHPPLFCAF